MALLKARQAHQAAHASLQQPCLLQQPYWCDGAGADAAALAAWQQAGLALRAVVHLKASAEGAGADAVPTLIAGAFFILLFKSVQHEAGLQTSCCEKRYCLAGFATEAE